MTVTSVLVAGAGQLGSRYLQGMSLCKTPLRIHVYDVHEGALNQALSRWNEVADQSSKHVISLHRELDQVPMAIDLAIVSTSSNVRPMVVSAISERSQVKSWILEKVLAQSESALEQLLTSVGDTDAWVNTFRRVVPWHRELMTHFAQGQPIELSVHGDSWGLACNSVHFLDLVAWWTGSTLVEVHTAELDDHWIEAKRAGFFEIYGTLVAHFSDGSIARLTANPGDYCCKIRVKQHSMEWTIDEELGVARRSDGLQVPGALPFQSQFTAQVVDGIVSGQGCQLPNLRESVHLHKVFVASMLKHWQEKVDSQATTVPIT
jgi:hypothetical protein